MFTKEHYRVIASVLKEAMSKRYWEVHPFIMSTLIDRFKMDNPEFDEKQFLMACGVPEGCI